MLSVITDNHQYTINFLNLNASIQIIILFSCQHNSLKFIAIIFFCAVVNLTILYLVSFVHLNSMNEAENPQSIIICFKVFLHRPIQLTDCMSLRELLFVRSQMYAFRCFMVSGKLCVKIQTNKNMYDILLMQSHERVESATFCWIICCNNLFECSSILAHFNRSFYLFTNYSFYSQLAFFDSVWKVIFITSVFWLVRELLKHPAQQAND